MLLRYNLNDEVELAEITRMYHSDSKGYFVRQDGVTLCVEPVSKMEWLQFVGNMFCDGNMSLDFDRRKTLSIISEEI